MVYELADTEKATALFEGWSETLIWSCLQRVMGKIFVTDLEKPHSALAFVGCFAFYGGEPDRELVMHKPVGFVIMTPQNEAWASLIEECRPSAQKETRFSIRKDTRFDLPVLKKMTETIPEGYELRRIDAETLIVNLCIDPSKLIAFEGSMQRFTISVSQIRLPATLYLVLRAKNSIWNWDAEWFF